MIEIVERLLPIMARFAQFPGVNVYWMGRSYLGQNLWAADLTLPSPALLRSWPKESTTKAVIVYSGRQHANDGGHAPIRQQETRDAAGDGHQQALHHELVEKLPSARAQCDADRHFAAAL